eukprot:scaffold46520_cov69-Phaeocystis_antarctica.AAC.3
MQRYVVAAEVWVQRCRGAEVQRCGCGGGGGGGGGGTSSSMAGSSAAAAACAQAACESGPHSARISFSLHTSCGSGRNQSCTPSAASPLHQMRCLRASTACRNARVSGTTTSGSSCACRRSSASCPELDSSSRDSAPTGTPSTCASTASHSCNLVSSRVTDAGLTPRRFLALCMYHSHVAAASIPDIPGAPSCPCVLGRDDVGLLSPFSGTASARVAGNSSVWQARLSH